MVPVPIASARARLAWAPCLLVLLAACGGAAEDVSSGDAPAGDALADATPSGDALAGVTPAGDAAARDAPTGATPAGDVPAGDSAAARDTTPAPVDQAAFEQARNRAFLLMDAGAPVDQSVAALRLAHELDPSAYGVNARLGTLYVEQKRYAEALEHNALALAARPEDPLSRREVVWLSMQLGDPARALAEAGPLLAADEVDPETSYLAALALDQLGRRDEAQEVLVDLPEQDAASALTLRGRFALEAGELTAARVDLERALAQRPDDQAALRALADTCRRLGDAAGAARWDEVLALFVALRDNRFTKPASGRADRKVQRQASKQNEYIAAEVAAHEQRLTRLLELHPGWAEGYELLAAVLLRDGRLDEACVVIERLFERHGAQLPADRRELLRARFCEGGEG